MLKCSTNSKWITTTSDCVARIQLCSSMFVYFSYCEAASEYAQCEQLAEQIHTDTRRHIDADISITSHIFAHYIIRFEINNVRFVYYSGETVRSKHISWALSRGDSKCYLQNTHKGALLKANSFASVSEKILNEPISERQNAVAFVNSKMRNCCLLQLHI